jgi:hypothetical protein
VHLADIGQQGTVLDGALAVRPSPPRVVPHCVV